MIEVSCCDVRPLSLRGPVAVVLAEMIETGLLDEHQVPAPNALRANGVIDRGTRMIPWRSPDFHGRNAGYLSWHIETLIRREQ